MVLQYAPCSGEGSFSLAMEGRITLCSRHPAPHAEEPDHMATADKQELSLSDGAVDLSGSKCPTPSLQPASLQTGVFHRWSSLQLLLDKWQLGV